LLGIALSKINIALPFILPFVFQKNYRVLLAALSYVVGATLLLAFWVHSSPSGMNAWIVAAQKNNGVPYGPASLLAEIGCPANMAARVCAVTFLLLATATLGVLRKLPMLTLFGLAA